MNDHVVSLSPIDKAARDAVIEQRRVERIRRLTQGRDQTVRPKRRRLVADTNSVIIVQRARPNPVAASSITLSATSYTGDEGTVIPFTVTRANGFAHRVSVDWTITAPVTPNTGTVTFDQGEGNKQILTTAAAVPSTTIGTLTLSNPQNLSGGSSPNLVAPYVVPFAVTDVPVGVVITISLSSSSYSGDENTIIPFFINRVGEVATDAVSVDWGITGATVSPITGTAIFAAGETQVQVDVAAGLVLANEVGTLTLSNPQNLSDASGVGLVAPSTALFTVNDTTGITIDAIPDISLVVGQTRSMDQYINDPGLEVTYTAMDGLNASYASYDAGTRILSGVGVGLATGVTLKAVRIQLAAIPSSLSVPVGGFVDMDQYITDPDGEIITTSITGLNPAVATYDSSTRRLTGVSDGSITGATLVVTY